MADVIYMKPSQKNSHQIQLTTTNIGDIHQSKVTFSPGVTILTGQNATNRTSFPQAITAALGSDQATLKGDAEEGSVELTIVPRVIIPSLGSVTILYM
ncbi:hypothetical protein GCM10009000_063690 [Halobacterium noricense]|uniref:Rad50/SbcC-type AAA domain-containing protein n=1 Tax=Haladaptatus pallidirubidus TaxID=1008152 RepID=A0AAV3UJW8_9EURY